MNIRIGGQIAAPSLVARRPSSRLGRIGTAPIEVGSDNIERVAADAGTQLLRTVPYVAQINQAPASPSSAADKRSARGGRSAWANRAVPIVDRAAIETQ